MIRFACIMTLHDDREVNSPLVIEAATYADACDVAERETAPGQWLQDYDVVILGTGLLSVDTPDVGRNTVCRWCEADATHMETTELRRRTFDDPVCGSCCTCE